ncbi:hypothetical protein QN393_26435, partial [Pseudomonas sp. AB12(2023)]|nr:hypothetical protein [Pseudomonas sp. AB12(2023)]
HTAGYDLSVSAWFTENVYDQWQDDTEALDEAILDEFDAVIGTAFDDEGPFPGTLAIEATCGSVLRYGENSHQAAALYL